MPSDPRDYQVELGTGSAAGETSPSTGRAYLSVLFNCCKLYQRVYRAPDGQAYAGRCPRCGRTVRFPIGPGGTSERFFVVE